VEFKLCLSLRKPEAPRSDLWEAALPVSCVLFLILPEENLVTTPWTVKRA
jgi:hypothetical protein